MLPISYKGGGGKHQRSWVLGFFFIWRGNKLGGVGGWGSSEGGKLNIQCSWGTTLIGRDRRACFDVGGILCVSVYFQGKDDKLYISSQCRIRMTLVVDQGFFLLSFLCEWIHRLELSDVSAHVRETHTTPHTCTHAHTHAHTHTHTHTHTHACTYTHTHTHTHTHKHTIMHYLTQTLFIIFIISFIIDITTLYRHIYHCFMYYRCHMWYYITLFSNCYSNSWVSEWVRYQTLPILFWVLVCLSDLFILEDYCHTT